MPSSEIASYKPTCRYQTFARNLRSECHECLKVFADYLLDFGGCQLRHDPVVGVREWRRVNCCKRQGDQKKLGVYCASKFLVMRVGPHDKGCTDLKRCLLIPKLVIFDSRVCRGMPSLVAAPDGPETRPPHSANAVSIISLS